MLHSCYWFGAVAALAATIGGCYVGGDACKVGLELVCAGPGGCVGRHVCEDDGSFGECVCDETAGTDGGASTGGPAETSASSSTGAGDGASASNCVETTMFDDSASSGAIDCEASCSDDCLCPEGRVCQDGKCVSCEAKFTFRNDMQDVGDVCVGEDPVSMMFVSYRLGVFEKAKANDIVDVTLMSGERLTVALSCCMLDTTSCMANYDELCQFPKGESVPCMCDHHELVLEADFCGERLMPYCGG